MSISNGFLVCQYYKFCTHLCVNLLTFGKLF
nr:MAG TPA: hypothetical protein [Caudoviricetes sp.]